MIKVADYIAKRLAQYGVKHVFMISGGGAMHLNNAFGSNPDIEYICSYNEQGSAIATEGYSRTKNELGVVCVTTGPGGVNSLNGTFGNWTDSIPVLYISGQVKQETTITYYDDKNLRQMGDQEVDIISIAKPITKFAKQIRNPYDVRKILEEAIHTAISGRRGPVWIDVPMDIQGAIVDESKLEAFVPKKEKQYKPTEAQILEVIESLKKAERPVIVAGHGIRLADAKDEFRNLLNTLQIPVLTTFNNFDIIEDSNPCYIGRIGTVGQRAGNFALQNADLVIFLGTRNNIRQTSYNWENYVRFAKKCIGVDIDPSEMNKKTINIDLKINADAKLFIKDLSTKIESPIKFLDWLKWCQERKEKYYPIKEYIQKEGKINPYIFVNELTSKMKDGSLMVAGNGSACVCMFQAAIIKKDSRYFWNSGNASMGYALPASIGACIANNKKETFCITGDGSIMMNIQELQCIKHNNLPIKIIILNNDGYISIIQTQKNFFNGHLTACSKDSGVSNPDFCKVAEAFGINSVRIDNPKTMREDIDKVLKIEGPLVIEIMLDDDYEFTPKLSSRKLEDGSMVSSPLEDLYPFLDKEEFESNMIK